MSFEFYGAILAREWLLSKPDGPDNEGGGPEIPRHQADSITEAIIRHQDLECVKKGNITVIGQLLQLATLLDNAGKYGEMVHTGTIDDIIARYPRLGWRDCFCRVIEKETELKPWCHTSKLGRDEFVAMVKGNELMERYEDTLIV